MLPQILPILLRKRREIRPIVDRNSITVARKVERGVRFTIFFSFTDAQLAKEMGFLFSSCSSLRQGSNRQMDDDPRVLLFGCDFALFAMLNPWSAIKKLRCSLPLRFFAQPVA